MSESAPAVFLSYAREDTAAARRIAEALRAVGVEVWFDQDELTGGDQWDQKIRGQIGACALFIPVISVNTQARQEGYFRLEWKLAEDRSHLMVKGKPFIVPVSIDATSERGAWVPDAFRAVQWTKLPGGETPPAFIMRVQKLLGAPSAAALSESLAPPTTGPSVPPAKSDRFPLWASAAVIAAVLALAGYFVLRPAGKEAAVSPQAVAEGKPARVTPTVPALPLVSDKSIAVLPFDNMSEDREASAFFADGVHEDILTNLSLIKELRVVSRTSVMQYRSQKKPLPQIARELGVSYILEGSVRRAGKQVRVSGKLIKAATDEPVWANAYDRDSTDALTIQAGLAMEIASALRTVLSPAEKVALEQRSTHNLEAYDLLLKAREIKNGPISAHLGNLPKVQQLLERAVELDPKFASAWVELVFVRAMRFHAGASADRRSPLHRASAKAALDRARELVPDSVDIVKARGEFLYRCDRNFAAAASEWEKIPRLYPNDPEGWYSMAIVCRRLGRWPEAIDNFQRVAQLDPANLRNLEDLKGTLQAVRRYDDAVTISRRVVALGPADSAEYAVEHATIPFLATGSVSELDAVFSRVPMEKASQGYRVMLQRWRAIQHGNKEEAQRLTQEPWPQGRLRFVRARDDALVFAALGDRAGVEERAERVLAELRKSIEQQADDALLRVYTASLNAFLGNREEAIGHALRATEIFSEKEDAVWGPQYSVTRAQVHAWAGDKEWAIGELARLLRVPYGPNVHVMRASLWYQPLRGDPRFEELLNDPKNNAPLF